MPQESTLKHSVEMDSRDDKRHSVRWDADEKDGPLATVYLRKPFFQSSRRIRVTIEELE